MERSTDEWHEMSRDRCEAKVLITLDSGQLAT